MNYADSVDSTSDIIDTRDVLERVAELEHDTGAYLLDDDEADELASLRDLLEQCGDLSDGATLIRDSYFEDYARELARDVCGIEDVDAWPASHIDWEAAADSLRMDYMAVDWDGVTYWVR